MKQKKSRLTPSGFTVCRLKKDAIKKHHYLFDLGLGTHKQQFEAFRGWVMENSGRTPAASHVLACLLAFDGILVSADLSQCYQNLSAAQDVSDRRISWRIGLRHDARNLSCMTLLAMKNVQAWPSYEDAIEGLLQAWNQALQPTMLEVAQRITWEDLLRQAHSWSQAVLPPALFGHASGLSPFSALPSSALQRKSTQLAKTIDPAPDDSMRDAFQAIRHFAYEAVLLGSAVASLGRPAFCAELKRRLQPPAKGSVSFRRQEVAKALRAMTDLYPPNDEGCALLLLFAVDLVENGTRRKHVLAPETPSKYVSAFAVDWLQAFEGISIAEFEAQEYEKRFKSLLVEGNSSERIAGLKAFQYFLHLNWDVPGLSKEVFPDSPETEVRANVLWPHEKQRIRGWIDEAKSTKSHEDDRRVSQLQVAFEIAAHVPLRIKELLMLRIHHVVLEEHHIVIEIARAMRDGREKSKEGRRRVKLTDEVAMKVLRAWLQRRGRELSDEEDYLFGDPKNHHTLYAKGWMYDTLNQLLKQVSGDEHLSVHTLRHTYASFALARIFEGERYGEINPLDQLANEMGHVGGHVTTRHYCHIFEPGLRRALDLQPVECTYEAVARWVALSPDTLRKRVSRAGGMKDAKLKVFEKAFENSVNCLQQKSQKPIKEYVTPVNPISSPMAPKPLDVIALILMDMASGIKSTSIALRNGTPSTQVEKIAQCVSHYVLEYTNLAVEIADKCAYGFAALKDAEGTQLGFKPSFQHLQRAHWQKLLKGLAVTSDEDLAKLLSYWQRARKGSHLSVHGGDGWSAFLQLLKRSGLHFHQMVLAHDLLPEDKSDGNNAFLNQLESAQDAVKSVFGDGFILSQCKHRSGQPSVRLLILQKPLPRKAASPITCMHGLHCLFLAAWVARRISAEAV